jgi:hypothetical protein
VCCGVLVKPKTFYMVSFLLFGKLVEILNIVVIETISKIGCVMTFHVQLVHYLLLRNICTSICCIEKVGNSE